MCEKMFQFYVSKITREKKQQPIAEGAPNQTIGKLKKAKRLTQSKKCIWAGKIWNFEEEKK